MTFQEVLQQKFQEYHIPITQNMADQFYMYYQILIQKNQEMNLTAITDHEEVIVKHFLDSCLGVLDIPTKATVMDIGCGAGFPSIPLKIIRPDLQMILVDSLQKRTHFLQDLCQQLHLTNVTIIHSRAEDLAKNTTYREQCDVVVARAVAKLPTLLEYCLPFVKKDGLFLAYKSNIEEELSLSSYALQQLGGKVEQIHTFDLYGQQRSIVLVKKTQSTPLKYPRGQNKPRLAPLLPKE